MLEGDWTPYRKPLPVQKPKFPHVCRRKRPFKKPTNNSLSYLQDVSFHFCSYVVILGVLRFLSHISPLPCGHLFSRVPSDVPKLGIFRLLMPLWERLKRREGRAFARRESHLCLWNPLQTATVVVRVDRWRKRGKYAKQHACNEWRLHSRVYSQLAIQRNADINLLSSRAVSSEASAGRPAIRTRGLSWQVAGSVTEEEVVMFSENSGMFQLWDEPVKGDHEGSYELSLVEFTYPRGRQVQTHVLYSRSPVFKSRHGDRLLWLSLFVVFQSTWRRKPRELYHGRFLPNPFQFVSY